MADEILDDEYHRTAEALLRAAIAVYPTIEKVGAVLPRSLTQVWADAILMGTFMRACREFSECLRKVDALDGEMGDG